MAIAQRSWFARSVPTRITNRTSDESGNAVLEFVVLSAFLLVPLIYLILAALQVQGSAYGATEAAREAGRAFVEADTVSDAYAQACAAATVALRNQVSASFDCGRQLAVSCAAPAGCSVGLIPGNTIRVEVDLSVGLPFLPTSVFGQPLTVSVGGVHDEVVDAFRASR